MTFGWCVQNHNESGVSSFLTPCYYRHRPRHQTNNSLPFSKNSATPPLSTLKKERGDPFRLYLLLPNVQRTFFVVAKHDHDFFIVSILNEIQPPKPYY